MSWKKSKDGGIDYDVEYIVKTWKMQERHRIAREKFEEHRNKKKNMFDVAATAHTVTFNYNIEDVEF